MTHSASSSASAPSTEAEVLAAAGALVSAFADGRLDDYFASFAPDATFVFHSTPERLGSLDRYRDLWRTWQEEDGFRVAACTSRRPTLQLLGETAAVFAHDVETRVRTRDGVQTLHERETIVFARRDGRWLAVHEHLSPAVPA